MSGGNHFSPGPSAFCPLYRKTILTRPTFDSDAISMYNIFRIHVIPGSRQ